MHQNHYGIKIQFMRREQLLELGDLFLMSLAFTLSCI